MMDALAKGDEVVTAGGILGKVSKVTTTATSPWKSRPARKSSCRSGRSRRLLPKGTLKSL